MDECNEETKKQRNKGRKEERGERKIETKK